MSNLKDCGYYSRAFFIGVGTVVKHTSSHQNKILNIYLLINTKVRFSPSNWQATCTGLVIILKLIRLLAIINPLPCWGENICSESLKFCLPRLSEKSRISYLWMRGLGVIFVPFLEKVTSFCKYGIKTSLFQNEVIDFQNHLATKFYFKHVKVDRNSMGRRDIKYEGFLCKEKYSWS